MIADLAKTVVDKWSSEWYVGRFDRFYLWGPES